MKDSHDKKKLAIPRRRGTALKPAASQDTPTALAASPAEVVVRPESTTEWQQTGVCATDVEPKIAQILLDSFDPETILPKIARILGEAFGVEYCAIIVMAGDSFADKSSVSMAIQDACWYAKSVRSPLLTHHPSALLAHLDLAAILASSDPLALPDVRATESGQCMGNSWEGLPIEAVLAIKTRFQNYVNGVIAIMHSKAHGWTASEKERLCNISDSVAMAISQVQLQRQVNASSGHQALLNQLTMAIRSYTDLDRILQLAIDGTARTLQVDRGFILLLKYLDPRLKKTGCQKRFPNGVEATVACEWSASSPSEGNQNPGSWLNYSFGLSKCILCQEAFVNAPRPMVIADKQAIASSDTNGEIASIFDLNTMPALLLVPLESQDTVLGFLALQQSQPRVWLAQELELVELVSAQMSTAILQFQTLRQTSALVEERTYQLQSILKVQAKLYEKTRQQVDQLRQLNQLKDEFIDTISDQLRNPLASMRMAIRMLRQPGLPAELQSKYLEILDQQCNREINLIDDILALQELKSKKAPLQMQKIDLKQTIEVLGQSFEEKWAGKGLTLAVDLPTYPLMLQSDPDSLDRILQELLTNAGKYSDPDTIVRFGVLHECDCQIPQISLSVCNIGSPISATEQEFIFEQFRRGNGVSEQIIQGTGLGLALVKCLVQHLNGTIAVSSNPIDRSHSWLTSFTVTLPQMQGS